MVFSSLTLSSVFAARLIELPYASSAVSLALRVSDTTRWINENTFSRDFFRSRRFHQCRNELREIGLSSDTRIRKSALNKKRKG